MMIKVLLKLKDLDFYGFLTECWPIIFRTSRAETRQGRYLHGSFWSLPWWSFDLPPYCLLRDFFCAVDFFPRRRKPTVFLWMKVQIPIRSKSGESKNRVVLFSWLGTRLECPICFFFVGRDAPSSLPCFARHIYPCLMMQMWRFHHFFSQFPAASLLESRPTHDQVGHLKGWKDDKPLPLGGIGNPFYQWIILQTLLFCLVDWTYILYIIYYIWYIIYFILYMIYFILYTIYYIDYMLVLDMSDNGNTVTV